MKKLGIVCPRGGGDIIIVLPIAKWYYDLGYEIHWVIDKIYYDTFVLACPWINFIKISPDEEDQGPLYGNIFNSYWCEKPVELLKELNCEPIFRFLYEDIKYKIPGTERRIQDDPLSIKAFQSRLPLFKGFDSYRYAYSNVPFINKWSLSSCIERQKDREDSLFNKVITENKPHAVFHLVQGAGGANRVNIDKNQFIKSIGFDPEEIQCVEIEQLTDNALDWLKIIETSELYVGLDSMFSNMVDQMLFTNKKYFIRLNELAYCPIFGSNWDYIPIELPTDSQLERRQYADRRPNK